MQSRSFVARIVAVLVIALSATILAPLPVLAAPVVVIDEGGANDQGGPGQKDLTRHSVDTAGLPTSIAVTWNWDIVTIDGKNTADGCALFDTDGDGRANKALCVTWSGSTPTQVAGSPTLYTCNDSRADRCAGAVAVAGTLQSTCNVSVTATDPFGPNVPNGPGTGFPNDTTASCNIVLSEVGAGAQLINTCSYPSAQPNSDPSDCVLIPRDAFIKVVKVANPAEDGTDFNFNLSPPGGLFATIDGSGETAFLPVRSDVPVTLTEVVPTGWTLTTISCSDGSPSVSNPSVTVDLVPDQQVTCTFTNIQQNPSLNINKEGSLNLGQDGAANPGDVISYTFFVENTGNVDLTGVTVTDPLAGLSAISCPSTTLAVGASMTCTATYAITQADINAGEVNNTATADSTQSAPDTDDNTETIPQTATLELDKEGTLATGTDGATPGDVISYTFDVTNTGNVTLTGITVTDPLPGLSAISCPATTLAVGASMTCTATYAITQADINAGQVQNTATADSTQSGPDSDSNIEPIAQAASINIDKEGTLAEGTDGADPDDVISYTFTVTNTGNVTLTGITVTDPLTGLSAIDCEGVTTLAPGASMECTATYSITQADIDAGEVENTATADSNQTGPDQDTEVVPITQSASLILDKEGTLALGPNNLANPNDVISYTFDVENTGNVTLTNITVSDPLSGLSLINCPSTTLAPGASMECTATYMITQADIDAGEVENTATADSSQSDPDIDTETVPIPQAPSITIDKEGSLADGGDGADPGDVISYTFLVTNTGNVTLTNVTVTDPLTGLSAIDCGGVTTLAPGASVQCSATYAITQADIDAGRVDNTATADSDESEPDTDDNTETITRAPALDTLKSGVYDDANDDGITNPGDEIDYTITVSNTGNVTLTGVTVSDPLAGTLTCTWPTATTGVLPVGTSVSCTGTYVITQADIDAGNVHNVATGDSDQTGPDTDEFDVPLQQSPAIHLEKEGDLALGDDGADPGDVISYTFTVTNTGNVTLTGITVTDPLTGLSAIDCPSTTLAPGADMTCTATYAITQDDIDVGSVDNTGTADSDESEPDDDTNIEPIPQVASIEIDKEGTLDEGDDGANPGDEIEYTFLVTNTGNVTLTNVTVTDPLTGLSAIDCPSTTLAPDAFMTCTATYFITQADIDVGQVENTATADSNQSEPDEDTETVPISQSPALETDKEGVLVDVDENDRANPGDRIDYTITVTNIGNQTLTVVTVSDPRLPTLDCTWPGTEGTLTPGQSVSCTGSYTLTQADIDAGEVLNTATGDSDQTPPDDEEETVVIPQVPALTIDKEGTIDEGDDGADPGDVISYTFVVTNTGNVTLTNITVTDPLTGLSAIDCPSTTLAPEASMTCTATYTITQSDIDVGEVENTATADSDESDPDSDTETVPISQTPAIDTVKTGVFVDVNDNDVANPGDRIDYSVTVTNTGNQTLTGVTVTDVKLGTLTCTWPTATVGTLPVGTSVSCTGSYTITQADIDAGTVHNVAVGDSDQTPPDEGEEDVPIEQEPSIDTVKTGVFVDVNDNDVANPGDRIDYSVTVTNTGNQTLTGVTVTDVKLGTLTCTWPTATVGTLPVGTSVSCTGSYTITQADIDAGTVHNVAVGDSDQTPPDEGEEDVPIEQEPSIDTVKTGVFVDVNDNDVANPGDRIDYSVTVTNTGNQTLTGVTVTDVKLGTLTCTWPTATVGTLPVGTSVSCTGSYTITQADIDAGTVHNVAVGDSDQTPPDEGEEDVPIEQEPSIDTVKTGVFVDVNDNDVANPGDRIDYSVTVTNTGNQTLTGVTVTDVKLGTLTCTWPTATVGTLPVGTSVSCTGSYTITQADIDAGTVHNVAVGDSDQTPPDEGEEDVPIEQEPDMSVAKNSLSEDVNGDGLVNEGDTLTYTITVTNTGNQTLTGVTVSDSVPSQTTFVSCTDGCTTDGPPVTEATWTITTPIPPGESEDVSMTVRINSSLTSCQICNTAVGESDFTEATSSNNLCLAVTPGPHPEGANANGDAYAAKIDVDLLGIDTTLIPVDSSQSGVGADTEADDLLSVSLLPPTGNVLRAGLLQTTSSSVVSAQPARASNIGTAEVLGVNVLNGLVTADVVRAVAETSADGGSSSFSALGSTFKNLKVRGVAMNNVAPNTTVKLPAVLFGAGSYVRLYERIGSTSKPANGQLSGGTYAADLTVNMIRVHVTNLLVLGGVDVIVSHASAHADFPQTTLCPGSGRARAVSGHAFVAHAAINPELLEATVGFVGIPASGGADHQALDEVDLLEPDGDVVHAEAASSDSWGAIGAAGALSSSYAQAADVCVLRMANGCTVGATLVRSQSSSQAGGGTAFSVAGGSQLVGLVIGGTPINITPAANTVIELPGLGFVILNEQLCDGTAALPNCTGTTSSGLTVRSIRVVITVPPILVEGLGVEVIVAEAHADTFAAL